MCEGLKDPLCSAFAGPFQCLRCVGRALSASDPTKVEKLATGFSGSGMGIDSQGNVWVKNRFGSSEQGKVAFGKVIETMKSGGNYDRVMAYAMLTQKGVPSVLRRLDNSFETLQLACSLRIPNCNPIIPQRNMSRSHFGASHFGAIDY